MGNATSSTAWDTIHTRTAALRELVVTLDAGHELPWDATTAPHFDDRDDLLLALHGVWSRRLQGRIDLALEVDERPLEQSVAAAWVHTTRDLPGVRRVLDEHADEPALRHADRIELRAVAVAAGLATFDDPIARSATAGARLVGAARGTRIATPKRPSFGQRLKLALAS